MGRYLPYYREVLPKDSQRLVTQVASYSFLVLRVWSWELGDFICILTANSKLYTPK
jgi:hypothetical protein